MPFKEILRSLRLERGLTQDELSKDIGIKRSAISMYENGKREPSFKTLEMFADYFNVDMNYLLGKQTKSTYYLNPETARLAQEVYDNPDLRILFDASRHLTPEDIKFVVEMVKKMKGLKD